MADSFYNGATAFADRRQCNVTRMDHLGGKVVSDSLHNVHRVYLFADAGLSRKFVDRRRPKVQPLPDVTEKTPWSPPAKPSQDVVVGRTYDPKPVWETCSLPFAIHYLEHREAHPDEAAALAKRRREFASIMAAREAAPAPVQDESEPS